MEADVSEVVQEMVAKRVEYIEVRVQHIAAYLNDIEHKLEELKLINRRDKE